MGIAQVSSDVRARPSTLVSAWTYTVAGTVGPAAVLLRLGAPVSTVVIAVALLATGQFVVMRSLLSGWTAYRRAALLMASQWITGAVLGGGLSVASNVAADQSAWVVVTMLVFGAGLVGLVRLVLDVPEPRLATLALGVEFAFALALYLLLDRFIRPFA